MKISGIVLDLDGVLIDTESISKKAWIGGAQALGFDFPDTLYSEIVGISVASARKKIEEFANGRLDMDRYMEISAAMYYDVMKENGIRTMPGVPELLDFISQFGLKSTVATSTTKDSAEWKLKTAGLFGVVENVVTGDQVKNGKPAPDIYLAAAEKIGLHPNECAVIEDAHAGIVGASAAGTVPIMVPSTVAASAKAEELAYAVVPTIYEAIEVLRDLV